MAARRITRSSIDWAKIAERVPEDQKPMFQMFKSKCDGYLRKAFALPEKNPTINWDFYKSRGLPVGLLEQFEKQYAALNVPYPKENVTPLIDEQEKTVKVSVSTFVAESNQRIETLKKELKKWDNFIPFEYMTMDDFKDHFPDNALDPLNRPTILPHEYGHLCPPGQTPDVPK